jgi:hypothetical protein
MERRIPASESCEEGSRASQALQDHLDAHRAELISHLAMVAEEGEQAVPLPGLLTIPSDVTSTIVYVIAYCPIPGSPVAISGFGLSKFGPFFTEGIQWAFQKAGSLHVIWSLQVGVSYLTSNSPGVSFSPPFEGEQLSVVPAEPDRYAFTVHFTKGGSEDPQIVVTPL